MNGTSVGMRLLAITIVAASVSSGTASAAMHSVPEYLKSAVVYQIVLRNFTRGGDFKAATAMLDHVRSIGVDVVYVTPFVEADRDMDQSGWSKRMKIAGYGSPKNPYRIANYDKVDPEYGSEEDFNRFCDRAHSLGMKVYMDLVYMHCGPNNVMKDMFDDAFQRNPDGTVHTTVYNFPFVNFESGRVRKYLIDSMLHWISLGCDGFRCDVGCGVPLDFWVEAVTACQKIKLDLVMINEGILVEYLDRAFDSCYAFPFSFALREFVVPAAATEVRVKVQMQCDNIGALYDAAGRRVAERKPGETSQNRVFLAKRTPTAEDELWAVGFDSNIWLNTYQIGSPALPIVFASPESAMVFRK